ncbi:MAG: sulfatase-like hydrolase/transferase [Oscillospiraceae bacterium]|nr:sulfatase-like hydrolase/transferase [Oscillospiraceae bacterium]
MSKLKRISSFFKKHDSAIVRTAIMLVMSFAIIIFSEWIVRDDIYLALNWVYDRTTQFVFSSMLVFLLTFFLFAIMRRIDFPILISGIVVLGLSTASYFKATYRSEPLFPWDLLIASEAADISSEMVLIPTLSMYLAFSIIIVIFAALLIWHIIAFKKGVIKRKKVSKKKVINISVQAVVSFLVLVCYTVFVLNNIGVMKFFGITEYPFRQSSTYKKNGFLQSFVMHGKYILPDKPDDYNEDTINTLLSQIDSDSSDEEKIKPNIIYVMSESFADLTMCENVTFHDDIFKYTNYVRENGIYGSLLTSQFGGGTCNSEFEVLTGFSMNNLPTGCTPYQQYFNEESISYAKYLKGLGYKTVAIHSYGEKFWNRNVAYPNMGFDEFISEEDFVDPLRRRGLIKDDSLVDRIIEEYEKNLGSGQPFFNFSVTMQNHGSFTSGQYLENYRTHLSCDELTEDQEGVLITYATGIRDADNALGKLMAYFSRVKEPTIICMFGDHLGSLAGSDEIYVKAGYMNDPESSAEDKRRKYSTPFFVWDNYTTDKQFEVPNMSLYNLVPSICEWYNLDTPKFFEYLYEQSKVFRGSSTQGIFLDSEGNAVYELPKEAEQYFENHKLFQYDLMFGKNYSLNEGYTYKPVGLN